MKTVYSNYIGKITIQSLRHLILDSKLSEEDTVLINQVNYDELALEYKETYSAILPTPFVELGILIDEDLDGIVPEGRINIIKGDNRLLSYNAAVNTLSEADEIIYRCGWCGNVVDFDDTEYDPLTRLHKIHVLEKHRCDITEKSVSGVCCPNRGE